MVCEIERLDRPRSQARTMLDPATRAETEPVCATPTTAPCPAIWLMIQELAWAHYGTNDGPRALASARDTTWLARAVHDQ
jgi:hypothetical protein